MVTPKDFGLKAGRIDHLKANSAKESAKIIRDVLASRRRDEARSLIVLNAAAALVIGGIASTRCTPPVSPSRVSTAARLKTNSNV